jgi:hypothetical protein
MQQIADWLDKLGLSEYAQRFAENGIDVSVLRHLTDQDLEKVGVLLGFTSTKRIVGRLTASQMASASAVSVLLTLHIRLDVARRHQPNIMTQLAQFPRPIMRSRALLYLDQTRCKLREER